MEKFEEKIETKKEKKPEIQPPEFEIKEFEKARENFENLTEQLTPAIRNHEYNVVIGDDASGRIPALVISGLMKEVYKEDKVISPRILFLAGGHYEEEGIEKDAFNYLNKLKTKKIVSPKDNILLVTEYIDTAISISRIIHILKKVGLNCDIVALGVSWLGHDKLGDPKEFNCPELKEIKSYSGGIGLHFYRKSDMSGVEKHGGQVLAKRRKGERKPLIETRQDVKTMVNYLKQIYDREKEKIEKEDSVRYNNHISRYI